MKSTPLVLLVCAGCVFSTRAGVTDFSFTSGFVNGGNIPDGSRAGWSDSRTLSGLSSAPITDVTVKLNISGGYNGDLYGYLSYDGTLVPLMNRVGVTATGSAGSFGSPDTGLNVALTSAGTDIHDYAANSPSFVGGQLIGTWQADGRTLDPLSSAAAFDSASRVTLSSLSGKNPNGTWTLFFADLSNGGGQSQVVSWELDIEAVPEPVNFALAIAGAAGALALVVRGLHKRVCH